jgi:SAM-dependent methyltransferase
MNAIDTIRNAAPDWDAIKARQRATWAAGDYGYVGVRSQVVAELLCDAADVCADERVLDVAAGNGNAALAAARRYAAVTAIDYVPALLEEGRARAAGERLDVDFRVADAEALPFPDGAFDVALSTFGAMFAPNQPRAAGELARVVRPGGRIGLACWTPEGFTGHLFRLLAGFVPSPEGVPSPMLWGAEPRLVELFGPRATNIRCARREWVARYRSAEHWIDVYRTHYGPVLKAFAALPPARQSELHVALIALLSRHNRDRGNGRLVIAGEYLETVIVVR